MPDFQVAPRAQRDILEIAEELADLSPPAALRFVDTIEAAFLQLQEYPESGVARTEIGPHIRILTRHQWLIVYLFRNDVVEIARVVSARRRISDIRVGD